MTTKLIWNKRNDCVLQQMKYKHWQTIANMYLEKKELSNLWCNPPANCTPPPTPL